MSVYTIAAAVKTPLIAAVCAFSALSFLLMGLDKRKAKTKKGRVRERTLLLLAACFGGIGAYLGMEMFRHKTKKLPFPWLVPLFALFQSALLIAVFALSSEG
ncbi:MAG: DUF1294 domain-containing protein [Christensenellales bacterium]|jgi:uncharacterized membrane protein YsdA (DUF1294 family)